ncbi:hypothetical protein Tco_0850853 [Tanacetum coccineum]
MVWGHPNAAIDDLRPAAGSFSMAHVRWLNTHVIKLRDMPEGVLVLSGLSRVLKSYLLAFMIFYAFPSRLELGSRRIPISMLEDLAVVTLMMKVMVMTMLMLRFRVTPLRSTAVIPSPGNQGRSSTVPAAEGSNTRDSQGKGIMADDAATPSVGIFFPFPAGPYYATYPQDGVAGNYEFTRKEWDALYQPTFEVLTKEVLKDPAIYKTMVDQFSTPGEMLLACYLGLLQSHHEYVQLADSRLKGYEERVAGVAGLELQVSTLKKHVFRLNDKLVSSDASFAKSKAKGKERKKKVKSLTKSLDNLHVEVARLYATLNQDIVLEVEKDEEDLVQKFLTSDEFSRVLGELLSLVSSAGFEHGLSMHHTRTDLTENLARPAKRPLLQGCPVSTPPITKESTVTPASKSLEVSTNADLTPSVIASEHKWSGVLPPGLNDVVVTLSAGEKGNGLFPFSAADEDAATNPSGL